MSRQLKQTSKYCIIPHSTINIIWNLKINKCPSKLGAWCNNYTSKVNTKNLVHIQLGAEQNLSSNVRIATVNARSVKNKLDLILETSNLENLDFLVISETWIGEDDAAWISTSCLDNNNYRINPINRQGKQRGGVALLHKDRYQVTRDLKVPQLDLLEYVIWTTRVRNKTLTIVGVYNPPLGATRNTPVRFLVQVSELV